MSDEEMIKHHKEGIDEFLANVKKPNTKGYGTEDAEFKMDGDVKVFDLVCEEIDWEVTPGQIEKAMAYNGTVPGPTLRAKEGEKIRINVKNKMTQSTTIHWHGMRLPNDQDGVGLVTQPVIKPNKDFTYEFAAKPAGSHMYHSHHNSTEQVGRGLLGALIVEPQDPATDPEYDQDHLIILNDALGGFTINGKGWPSTKAYAAKKGEKIRFRFMNEGLAIHPMHLHGFHMEVFARDGYHLPQPFKCDTLTVAPGERWDAIVDADTVGTWVFHCHILSHAEGPTGMFGMITALVVE